MISRVQARCQMSISARLTGGSILIKAAERRVIGSAGRKDGGSAAGAAGRSIVASLTEEPALHPTFYSK
jgi:hypothetical protein